MSKAISREGAKARKDNELDRECETDSAMALVGLERARQRELLRKGKFRIDVSNPQMANLVKLPVLAEELGEVSKEINDLLEAVSDDVLQQQPIKKRLKTELVQLAAVAVAWVEALEQEGI